MYAHIYKVVNMPSTPSTRHKIIEDIKTLNFNHDNIVIYECGSGWGGFTRAIARAFPKTHVYGFEISPIPYLISKIWPLKNAKIKRQNLFECDFKKADIVIMYLSPYHMKKLDLVLKSQMKKGSVLYSQGFPIENKKPDNVIKIPYSIEKKVYKYRY
jgi:16S rRNA A1518/A1519 N6-dimethyltransferase RsmA/KsgA/DIM1 with predicted DNA glycosylase/AP lyase activity